MHDKDHRIPNFVKIPSAREEWTGRTCAVMAPPSSRRRDPSRATTVLLALAILWYGAGGAVSAALARSGSSSGPREGSEADEARFGPALFAQLAQEESDHKRRRRRARPPSRGRQRGQDEPLSLIHI